MWKFRRLFHRSQLALTLALAAVSLPVLFLGAKAPGSAQESYGEMVRRFDYDRSLPLDVKQEGGERRGNATVYDLSYASPKGGRVPAFLVVPAGKGPFGAILFGHWMMRASPLRNRREFLEEAVVLANAGAVCLLMDAPFVRPGSLPFDENPFSPGAVAAQVQEVVDVRRGVDLLLQRGEVDPQRIAYVGHSFHAGIGGILSGVEKRIMALVLMAGVLSYEETLWSDEPEIVALRSQMGEEQLRRTLAEYRWLDPAVYLPHSSPAAVLLQSARKDGIAGERFARKFLEIVDGPKQLRVYESGHALNAEARRDRAQWLRTQLRLGAIDFKALDKLPQLQ